MNKLVATCICVFIVLMLASCDNAQNNANAAATVKTNTNISADSNDSIEEKVNEDLISRIEDMENEINSLKEALETEKHILNNHGAVFNALDNMNGDNIYLGMDRDGEYITAVYIKIPKENYVSYEFFLLTGYETDGVPFLNCLIKPHYETADRFEEYGIDKDKFEIKKLMLSKLRYDETSALLIIMIDSNGNEYSQYIPSQRFMMDK